MRVVNIHKRYVDQPIEKVSELFGTLATKDDLIWPKEKWPAMKFREGFQIGSKGGHGPIRYCIVDYSKGEFVKFQFTKPEGFKGFHQLVVNEIDESQTEVVHEIRMKTSFKGTLQWLLLIRWLHNALIEDAFDKIENHFSIKKKTTRYNFWVKLLRTIYKPKTAN